jgi:hypothetical protein
MILNPRIRKSVYAMEALWFLLTHLICRSTLPASNQRIQIRLLGTIEDTPETDNSPQALRS